MYAGPSRGVRAMVTPTKVPVLKNDNRPNHKNKNLQKYSTVVYWKNY